MRKYSNSSRSFICLLIIAMSMSLAACSSTQLQTTEPDQVTSTASGSVKRCINLHQLDNTQILDKQNIAFHMIGREIYLNTLPRRCPGLHKHDALAYRNNTGSLCSVDIVYVLDQIGGKLHKSTGCGLGDFQPISAAELKALKAEITQGTKVDNEVSSPTGT